MMSDTIKWPAVQYFCLDVRKLEDTDGKALNDCVKHVQHLIDYVKIRNPEKSDCEIAGITDILITVKRHLEMLRGDREKVAFNDTVKPSYYRFVVGADKLVERLLKHFVSDECSVENYRHMKLDAVQEFCLDIRRLEDTDVKVLNDYIGQLQYMIDKVDLRYPDKTANERAGAIDILNMVKQQLEGHRRAMEYNSISTFEPELKKLVRNIYADFCSDSTPTEYADRKRESIRELCKRFTLGVTASQVGRYARFVQRCIGSDSFIDSFIDRVCGYRDDFGVLSVKAILQQVKEGLEGEPSLKIKPIPSHPEPKPADVFKPGDRVCIIKQNIHKPTGPNVLNYYLGIVRAFNVDRSDESFGHQRCYLLNDRFTKFHIMPMETFDADVCDDVQVKSLIENKDFEKSLDLLCESDINGDDVKLYPIPEQYFPRLNEIVANIKRAKEADQRFLRFGAEKRQAQSSHMVKGAESCV
jgi:hypothetical protein